MLMHVQPFADARTQTRVETSIGPVIVYQELTDREVQLVECSFDVLGKHPPSYVFWSGEIFDRAGFYREKVIPVTENTVLKIGDSLGFNQPIAFGIFLGDLKFKGKAYRKAGIWQSKVGPVLKEFPKHLTLIEIWRADVN